MNVNLAENFYYLLMRRGSAKIPTKFVGCVNVLTLTLTGRLYVAMVLRKKNCLNKLELAIILRGKKNGYEKSNKESIDRV